MSNKPVAPSSKNKKRSGKTGLSTFTKVILTLLLILALCVAGFIFHAWRVINKPIEKETTTQAASIEVLTPTGAPINPNAPTTNVPNPPVAVAASDQIIAASASDTVQIATTPDKPAAKPQATLDDPDMTPILPTNVPAATVKTKNSDNLATKKPKRTNTTSNKQLDHLF